MTIGTVSVPHHAWPNASVRFGTAGTRCYPPANWSEHRRWRDVAGVVYQDFRGSDLPNAIVQAVRPFSTFTAQAQAVDADTRAVPLFARLRQPPSTNVPIIEGITEPEGYSPWFQDMTTRAAKDYTAAITRSSATTPRNRAPLPPSDPSRDRREREQRERRVRPQTDFGAAHAEDLQGPAAPYVRRGSRP